eukprot:scaffold3763_cov165-Amphora_coffeaeformis.AAC.13
MGCHPKSGSEDPTNKNFPPLTSRGGLPHLNDSIAKCTILYGMYPVPLVSATHPISRSLAHSCFCAVTHNHLRWLVKRGSRWDEIIGSSTGELMRRITCYRLTPSRNCVGGGVGMSLGNKRQLLLWKNAVVGWYPQTTLVRTKHQRCWFSHVPRLSNLRALDGRTCIDQFQVALRRNGFVAVEIDEPAVLQGLQGAIHEARALDSFRFPPIQNPDDEPIEYNVRRQKAFTSLFDIAIVCLKAILLSTPPPEEEPPSHLTNRLDLERALQDLRQHALFENDPNEPFAKANQPFAQSFFNLFNYNYGLLNPHIDRSLVTVIYSQTTTCRTAGEEADNNKTALWIQDPDGTWHNADAMTAPSQVVIMTGEQLVSQYAAPHAVRVNPEGEFLAQAHHRRDPATTATNNRLSAALILRHGD